MKKRGKRYGYRTAPIELNSPISDFLPLCASVITVSQTSSDKTIGGSYSVIKILRLIRF